MQSDFTLALLLLNLARPIYAAVDTGGHSFSPEERAAIERVVRLFESMLDKDDNVD